jgi:hypothetical protein
MFRILVTSRRLVLIAGPIQGIYVVLVGLHDDLCEFPTFTVPFKTFGHRGAGTSPATTGTSTPTIDALSPSYVTRWLASGLMGRCTHSDIQ